MAKGRIILIGLLLILVRFSIAGGGDCIVDEARKWVGVRELTGNNDGEAVEKFLASTGLGEGYAWCMAYVNYVHQECDANTPDKAAWSPSWFSDERLVYDRGRYENEEVKPGDVGGLYFKSKGRIAHGFIVEKVSDKYYHTIEGNTNKKGSREGDGVYRRMRWKKTVTEVSRWYSVGSSANYF